ncbi:uncharacterized protein C8Q71DRAFT_751571 [Rhodofomes roseus]|uniref:Secreted protein n=1 Tax=Rhodofomes roseus TaxID=34475 RepID=A0ABQ8KK76_9APHY|nr:uncharacterized protein C8Q71DRAFT_751571 [Rhodofomes roseus]KAH9838501.1 hypothetical protein C8Q71DRAFT_751571 [Rhodofomes roseus]
MSTRSGWVVSGVVVLCGGAHATFDPTYHALWACSILAARSFARRPPAPFSNCHRSGSSASDPAEPSRHSARAGRPTV